MFHQAMNVPILRRAGAAGLGRLALVLGAAWALSAAVPAPAGAQDTNWKEVCSFKSSPQGYGEMIRERICMQHNACHAAADARGGMYSGAGCVMVPPAAAAAPQPAPRSTYTKR